ncbi:MAG: hypothetical protein ACE5EY_11820 [Anaerolineae bacterium]
MIPALIGLFGQVAPLLVGSKTVKKVKGVETIIKGKGLLDSKTANFAHAKVVASIITVWTIPLPEAVRWLLTAIATVIWAVELYLRVVTREKVG